MESELLMIIQQLDDINATARTVTSGLSDQQLLWKPGVKKWSIAECFDHLALVDAKDLPSFRVAAGDARTQGLTGRGPFRYGLLGSWFVRSLEPPVKRFKVKAPGPFVPNAAPDPVETMSRFYSVHDELRRIVADVDGLDLERVKVRLPFGPGLKISLGQRLQIITAHDRRHIWQAQQVRTALPSI